MLPYPVLFFFLWVFLCVGYLDMDNWVNHSTGTAVWTNPVLTASNQLVWSIPLYWQRHSQKFVHPPMQFEGKEHFLPVFRVTVLFSFCKYRSGICLLQGLVGSDLLPQSPLLCPAVSALCSTAFRKEKVLSVEGHPSKITHLIYFLLQHL